METKSKSLTEVRVYWDESNGPGVWGCKYWLDGTEHYDTLVEADEDAADRSIEYAVDEAIFLLDIPAKACDFAYEDHDGGCATWTPIGEDE